MNGYTPSVETVPDEILLKIFMTLPYPDILGASKVCRRWRNLSRDSLIARHIDIRDIPITAHTLTSFCRRAGPVLVHNPSDVRSIKIRGKWCTLTSYPVGKHQSHLTIASLELFASKFNQLEELHLEDFTLRRIVAGTPVLFPESLESLSCIRLSSVRGWFDAYVQQKPGAPGFQNLTYLDLTGSSFVCPKDMKAFKSCSGILRHLSITGCYRLSELSSWISDFPNLQVLLASRMRLTELPCLGVITGDLQYLQHLELRLAPRSEPCSHLIDRLSCCGGGNDNLEILDIRDWEIDEKRAKAIREAFPKLCDFQHKIRNS